MIKPNEALEVLARAAHAGQKAGAYTLAEAKIIAEAIEVFVPKKAEESPKEEVKEE
jgi:hypothetical protein